VGDGPSGDLELNALKTVEMVVDFRKNRKEDSPVLRSSVEVLEEVSGVNEPVQSSTSPHLLIGSLLWDQGPVFQNL